MNNKLKALEFNLKKYKSRINQLNEEINKRNSKIEKVLENQ